MIVGKSDSAMGTIKALMKCFLCIIKRQALKEMFMMASRLE